MDPVSIIGLATSISTIVGVTAKVVNALSTLQAKYRNANLSVFLLIGQLSTLKAALSQILGWIQSEGPAAQSERIQLVEDLDIALNSCRILISILDERIDQLANRENSDALKIQGKIVFLWEEQELNMYVTYLMNQVNALNLLLSAIQCRSLSREQNLLQSLECSHMIRRLRDDTSSLIGFRDSESVLSRTTMSTFDSKPLETVFDFDSEVFNSRAYQIALRSNMEQVLSYRASENSRPADIASCITNDTYSLANDALSADTEAVKASSELHQQNVAQEDGQLVTPKQTTNTVEMEWQPLRNGRTLISGTSKSEKSPLLQILKLDLDGLIPLERMMFKKAVFSKAVASMRMILESMNHLKFPFEKSGSERHAQAILKQPPQLEMEVLPADVVNAIRSLYMDFRVKEQLKDIRIHQLCFEGVEHYFCSILRLARSDYVPTNEDIFWAQVEIRRITENILYFSGQKITMVDIGCESAPRRIGNNLLASTDAILCVVDLLWYHHPSDREVFDRLYKTLRLFHDIVRLNQTFNVIVTLAFTNYDKFATKIKNNHFWSHPEYEGYDNGEKAAAFMTDNFLDLGQHYDKTIDVYYIRSIDDERSLAETAIDVLQGVAYNSWAKSPR